jgi:hypothetical protein
MAEIDYVKEILNEPRKTVPQSKLDETDWVREIFEEDRIGGTYAPKKAGPELPSGAGGPISTITGKPETEYIPRDEPGASFGTMVKNVFVDDPRKQIEIYAKARGISTSKYRIHNGEIIFRNKSGKWQRETGEGIIDVGERAAAQVANPAVVMGTVGGLTGNPLIAGTLAAGGEGIRKVIGSEVFGEEQTSLGNALDMSLQGVLAGGSELAGKLGAAGLRKLFLGGKPAQYAGKEVVEGVLTGTDHAKAQVIQTLARQHGMELAPHQLYDREGMTNIWMYLRKHPSTSDAIRKFEDDLAISTDTAMKRFIRDVGGYDEDPFIIGKKLSEIAEKNIDNAIEVRKTIASPLYRKAFQAETDVDIKPVIDYIDTELVTAKGEVRNQLLRAKKILEKPDLPKTTKGKKPSIVDQYGKPIGGTPDIENWETSLQGLHGSKIEFDRIIENAKQDSLGNTVKRNYQIIKDTLLKQMDAVSPDYAAARAEFARLSEPVKALEDSVMGALAKISKEPAQAEAYQKLMNLPSPLLLRRARQSIEPQDPLLWKQMVGSYMRDVYQGLKAAETEGGRIINVAGKMHKRLFGSEEQREMMKAVLSPTEYQALDDLMTVMKHASVGTARQSMTQPFGKIEEQIAGPLLTSVQGYASRAMKHPWDTFIDTLFETWNDVKLAGRQQTVLDTITSPDALDKIRKLKPLTPGSKKLIEGVSTYFGMILPKSEPLDAVFGTRMPEEQSRIQGRPQVPVAAR